jgi:hypothetical protein
VTPMPYQEAFFKPYGELYLSGGTDLDGVLVGYRGRTEFEGQVRRRGNLLMKTITPCTTRFSRVYVSVVGGSRADNTVVLAAARQGDPPVTRVLPRLNSGYRTRTRLHELGEALDAIEADYPPGTPTRTIAEALIAVMLLWEKCKRTHPGGIPLQLLDQVIGEKLEPWFEKWDLARETHHVDRLIRISRGERVPDDEKPRKY